MDDRPRVLFFVKGTILSDLTACVNVGKAADHSWGVVMVVGLAVILTGTAGVTHPPSKVLILSSGVTLLLAGLMLLMLGRSDVHLRPRWLIVSFICFAVIIVAGLLYFWWCCRPRYDVMDQWGFDPVANRAWLQVMPDRATAYEGKAFLLVVRKSVSDSGKPAPVSCKLDTNWDDATGSHLIELVMSETVHGHIRLGDGLLYELYSADRSLDVRSIHTATDVDKLRGENRIQKVEQRTKTAAMVSTKPNELLALFNDMSNGDRSEFMKMITSSTTKPSE